MKKSEWKKWFFWFSFAVASITVYKTIDSVSEVLSGISNLMNLLMPFVMGILVSYMFYIPSKSIEKTYNTSNVKLLKKHSRGLSVLTVYTMAIIIIFIAINFVVPALSSSLYDLANSLPNYYNRAIDFFNNLDDDSLLAKSDISEIIKSLEDFDFSKEILNWFSFDNISQYIKGIVGAAGAIFDIFVTFVISIYLLLERDDIKSFIKNLTKALFSEKLNKKISKYYRKTNGIFYNYIGSQVFDAFLVGIISIITMAIMKVKYATLLGVVIGTFNIIPYFGAIVAITIAIIITIFTGGISQAIWLGIVIIILQQIDANIINPRILGNSLNLSPILVIFSVTIGGAYFGVLGMFLGVPVMALIKIIIIEYINEKNNEKKVEG